MAHSDKINGFDRYDIREAVDTLIKAESIRTDSRKGFYETVKKELIKKTEAAEAAAVAARVRVESDGLTKLAKAKRTKG